MIDDHPGLIVDARFIPISEKKFPKLLAMTFGSYVLIPSTDIWGMMFPLCLHFLN